MTEPTVQYVTSTQPDRRAHTPGLLGRNIPPISKYGTLFAGRNTHVAVVVTRGLPLAEAEANADRLVDCWNACDGMANPVAEIEDLRARSIGLTSACAAIEFACGLDDPFELKDFLDAWMHGDWPEIREQFPAFDSFPPDASPLSRDEEAAEAALRG